MPGQCVYAQSCNREQLGAVHGFAGRAEWGGMMGGLMEVNGVKEREVKVEGLLLQATKLLLRRALVAGGEMEGLWPLMPRAEGIAVVAALDRVAER